jgi:hypothetical protein
VERPHSWRVAGYGTQQDRTQGAITASSVGLTVAPAARADKLVVAAEVIVSPCRSGRRVKAMTAMPITAIERAIIGGGGTLTGRFIDGYLIAMRPKDIGMLNLMLLSR